MLTLTLHVRGFASSTVDVKDVAEASRVLTKMQDDAGYGASELGKFHGRVTEGNVFIGNISYNGRFWPARFYAP